eukprot:TRINITY_DN59732_c0_g2_i1.p1 TRINITY_DN59732_c0_g2~~TRINITY_DN59732_c0_g2_i1.p1  ORF type:complete len:753 (+),score=67.34 TRINITY_DN59732_c0_g2_i1:322-2259(+)
MERIQTDKASLDGSDELVADDETCEKSGALVLFYLEVRLKAPNELARITDNLASTPVEALVLDLLTLCYAMQFMDSPANNIELEEVCALCNSKHYHTCVSIIQRCLLHSLRLPLPDSYEADYRAVTPQCKYFSTSFFDTTENTFCTDPQNQGGGNYVDILLVQHSSPGNSLEAVRTVKKINRITVALWYLPYLFAVATPRVVHYCVAKHPWITWKNVRHALRAAPQRFIHELLKIPLDKDRQSYLCDAYSDYLLELLQNKPQLCKDKEFVLHYVATLLQTASSSRLFEEVARSLSPKKSSAAIPVQGRSQPQNVLRARTPPPPSRLLATSVGSATSSSGALGVSPYSEGGNLSATGTSRGRTRSRGASTGRFAMDDSGTDATGPTGFKTELFQKWRTTWQGNSSFPTSTTPTSQTSSNGAPQPPFVGSTPPSGAAYTNASLDRCKLRNNAEERIEELKMSRVNSKIKYIIQHPQTYNYDPQDFVKIFSKFNYFKGLLMIEDSHELIISTLLHYHQFTSLFLYMQSATEDDWVFLLNKVYELNDSPAAWQESKEDAHIQAVLEECSSGWKTEEEEAGRTSPMIGKQEAPTPQKLFENVTTIMCVCLGADRALTLIECNLPEEALTHATLLQKFNPLRAHNDPITML